MSRRDKGIVVWFTGLSGAGKSTCAEALCRELESRGLKTEHLDGDAIRGLLPETGFSPEDRDRHIRRVGFIAHLLEKHGVAVVASFISPYRASRDFVRNLCHDFVEVHVSAPLDVCEARDPKGLYARARRGEIQGFTGIDAPYEIPERPELTIDTSSCTSQEAVARVLRYLDSRQAGQLSSAPPPASPG